MIRTVLVPLDGSPFSEHALPLGLSIARRSGATLQLLYVQPPLSSIYTERPLFGEDDQLGDHFRARILEQKSKYLESVTQRLEMLSGILPIPVVDEGEVVEAIREHVLTGGVDLVVMTTHGRGPLGRMLLGGVADELVRTLNVPMILVRPTEEAPDLSQEPAPKHLVLPLDGTPLAEQIIEPAAELGQMLGTSITLMQVVQNAPRERFPGEGIDQSPMPKESPGPIASGQGMSRIAAEQYLESVADRLRQRGLAVQTCVLVEDSPAEGILKEASKRGTDLIALETHGRRGISRLLLGSVAEKIVRGGTIPVLVHCPHRN
jgi:nucleotide-binding universal stress UspA family protein